MQILSDLKELFHTKQHAFVATCSGTGLLEAALLNCVPRRVLVTSCGAFADRWLKIAERLGVEADHLDHPWGTAVDADRLATHIESRRQHYDAVTITYNETSTGVMNNLEELAAVVHEESPGTLVLVDAVSALGGAPVLFDEWKLDVCLASTQKCLALPPGLAVFALSENALKAAEKKNYRGMYFDFLEYKKQAEAGGAAFTPAISLCFALAKELDYILRQETLEQRWKRHAEMRDVTLSRTASFADPAAVRENASVSVSALRPRELAAPLLVSKMKERGFTLGGGYGDWKESTFRIGHMGDITLKALNTMLDALEETARELMK
jgi:aspartate aminotransferase-like enzyme